MDDFSKSIRGRVLRPGDDDFAAALQPWNRAVDQSGVRAVVTPEDADDAAAVVRHARLAGLSVAAQAGGHGASAGLNGEILLRTSRLREVRVRPDERIARVEAGALWGEVLQAAAKHGLTGLAGSSPVVSATGFLLGGGLSWYSRKHGFGAGSVRALDVVDADGVRARVTADSDPELFWALRGGGGDFALVTAVEIDLFPAPALYGGRQLWPATQAPAVLDAFRQVTASAPEELTVWFTQIQFPPFPELPAPLRGLAAVAVDLTFLGGEADGRALSAVFDAIPGRILDTRGMLKPDEIGTICNEPTEPGAALMRGHLLTSLDDEVAAAVLGAAGPPLVSVQVRHLGGALSRPSAAPGAFGHLAEPYLMGMLGVVPVPEVADAVRARHAELERLFAPHTTGRKPFTYLSYGEKAGAAFPADALARLRDIKRGRDPHGVFRSNHSVLD
ncbi:FAD-binding oxidoreductase [Acrocarpospora corrugata]|nr:FAD-binding oxidoreductase [Acrocarpospora corrugata]